MISRAVSTVYDDAFRPLGVRAGQMNILTAIAQLDGAPPGRLAHLLCMDKSTVSRDVTRMRTAGWIEARPGDDGRSHELHLTPKGRRLLKRAAPAWKQAQSEARKLVGASGVKALFAIADRLHADEASTSSS